MILNDLLSSAMWHGAQETHFVAAYNSGDRVEYFSATKGKWLLGEAPRVQQKDFEAVCARCMFNQSVGSRPGLKAIEDAADFSVPKPVVAVLPCIAILKFHLAM